MSTSVDNNATVQFMVLERLFGSRVRARLLGWVFTHPGEQFSVRQLAAAVGEDPTQVSRELSRLQEIGIVLGRREGQQKFFSQDPACAIRAELEGLILKTVGAAGLIRAALKKIPGVELAFLYGSFAKGTAGAQSDIDLMIIGALTLETLDAAMADVERSLGRSVNYVLYDRAEFEAKRIGGEGFLADVLRGPVMLLVGDEVGSARA